MYEVLNNWRFHHRRLFLLLLLTRNIPNMHERTLEITDMPTAPPPPPPARLATPQGQEGKLEAGDVGFALSSPQEQ